MKLKLIDQAKSLNALTPVAHSGTTAQSGAIIDRLGYETAILGYTSAAATGSPSAATATLTLQHGNASNLSDAATVTLNTALGELDTSAAVFAEFHLKLGKLKRYIRLVSTPAFTDGTTPAFIAGAVITLGDKNIEPATSSTVIREKA